MRCMKTLWSVAAVAGLLLLPVQGRAQEAGKAKPKFIGVEKCGTCHKSAAKGDQLGNWQKSKHAQAYAVLATPEAKEVAKAKGIADPQKADACLKCHVTAAGVDAAQIEPAAEGKKGHSIEDGVGCESCHGAGSEYKSRTIMKDKQAAIKAGLVIPDEKTCTQCHNAESPTFKGFNYKEMLAKVAHPNPAKGSGGGE